MTSKSVLLLAIIALAGCSLRFSANLQRYQSSAQFAGDGFANSQPIAKPEYWQIVKKYWRGEARDNVPKADIPVAQLTATDIAALPADQLSVVRFGHSSTLLKISGQLWMLDPVFSERASPLNFAGPKRFHKPPMSAAELPRLNGVIISHNHYDHLDKLAIEQLRDNTDWFFVPLGLARILQRWGVAESQIVEFDWWQTRQVNGLQITATPAQHFSGRGVFDRNNTLWAGWALESASASVFYSGDTGYFSGFKQIGDRLGPFDLAMLETGAYDPLWPYVHMQPSQAIQASQDLAARHFMPVHNGTFDLAFHPWYEPYEVATDLAEKHQISLITPVVGKPVTFSASSVTQHNPRWWRDVK